MKPYEDIRNLTLTSNANSYDTTPTASTGDDMKRVLIYAIPLASVSIVMVLVLVVGILRRQHVLERWTSLKQMRNTNPRCLERTGLRRDSEYESSNDECISVTVINDDSQADNEPKFHLASIS